MKLQVRKERKRKKAYISCISRAKSFISYLDIDIIFCVVNIFSQLQIILNNQNHTLPQIIQIKENHLWHVAYSHPPHGFKTRLLRRGFPHSYKEYFVPLSNRCGISQSTSMTASDNICNSSSPPLVDIVRFDSLRIVVSLTILKRAY